MKSLRRLSTSIMSQHVGAYSLDTKYWNTRYVITCHGEEIAAMVSIPDLQKLIDLDNQQNKGQKP